MQNAAMEIARLETATLHAQSLGLRGEHTPPSSTGTDNTIEAEVAREQRAG